MPAACRQQACPPLPCRRLRLASTSTLLHAASLGWFPKVVLTKLPQEQEDVERLAEWLAARRGGCARLLLRQQCARRA